MYFQVQLHKGTGNTKKGSCKKLSQFKIQRISVKKSVFIMIFIDSLNIIP